MLGRILRTHSEHTIRFWPLDLPSFYQFHRNFTKYHLLNISEMGKAGKALRAFINEIPDDKLENLSVTAGTLYKDTNFRVDMQGVRGPDA